MNNNNSITSFGKLQSLMEDPTVGDILVDAPDQVLIHRHDKDGTEKTGIAFESEAALRACIDAILAAGGTAFQPGQMVCETRLPDRSRVLAILAPTAVTGPCLVIHKFFKSTLTVDQLIEYQALSAEMMDLLRSAIQHRLNILVAGGTSSGKTTLLNVLTGEIPPDERVVTVEERPEIQCRAAWQVWLSAEGVENLPYTGLIETAARMRPDRLIFGEIRGAEALKIMQLMSTGYDGCLVPLHANSAEDALSRLEACCRMSNPDLGPGEIRSLIASSLQLVTVQQRLPSGARKITEVVEICGLDKERYILQLLARYNPEKDAFEMMPVKPGWKNCMK